jgi:hypothetical protein
MSLMASPVERQARRSSAMMAQVVVLAGSPVERWTSRWSELEVRAVSLAFLPLAIRASHFFAGWDVLLRPR